MKPDCRDALLFALDKGIAELEGPASWLFYNAYPVPGLDENRKAALVCEQQFRPVYLNLKSEAYSVSSSFGPEEDGAQGCNFPAGQKPSLESASNHPGLE